MRVNVYSQELTSEVKLVSKESDGVIVTGVPYSRNAAASPIGPRRELTEVEVSLWKFAGKCGCVRAADDPDVELGNIIEQPVTYHAAQMVLHSSSMLHHPPDDDDRSAVTFWMPRSASRREEMARAFEEVARLFREAPSGTGLD
jgi:hypothetical protein